LELIHIRQAVEYVEKQASDLVDPYYEQANVFSGIVGIFGIKALDAFSPYKRHKHPDVAQQRFPDLSLGGKQNPPPEFALESKGSTRPWAVSPIMIIPAGTSYGATPSIRRTRSRKTDLS
jgi:hypothetical protein